VSLAALYAAALFIVARIPLSDIFLMATPLHSQNFVDVGDGILPNNRRLVTRAMWFNGTELSAQARRALENERVTLVAHETGYVHVLYPSATIQPRAYARFAERLDRFLRTGLTEEILGNFLRHRRDIQKCFQIRFAIHGVDHYIGADRAFACEQDNPLKLTGPTRAGLLAEIEPECFGREPDPNGIVLNDLETYLREHKVDLNDADDLEALRRRFACGCLNAARAIEGLLRFCRTVPRIPDLRAKTVRPAPRTPGITPDMEREDIVARLEAIRSENETAELAFYAYRDLTRTEPEPFLLAALERNPVAIAGARELTDEQVIECAAKMPNESIYDGPGRLAQPDEVWNYGRGDGVEKAVMLANILRARDPEKKIAIEVAPTTAGLIGNGKEIAAFESSKQFQRRFWSLDAPK
jgi:hypothetical protein